MDCHNSTHKGTQMFKSVSLFHSSIVYAIDGPGFRFSVYLQVLTKIFSAGRLLQRLLPGPVTQPSPMSILCFLSCPKLPFFLSPIKISRRYHPRVTPRPRASSYVTWKTSNRVASLGTPPRVSKLLTHREDGCTPFLLVSLTKN